MIPSLVRHAEAEAEIPFGGSRRRGGLFRVRPLSVATLLTCDQSGMRLGEGEKARKTKKWNIHDQNDAAGHNIMLQIIAILALFGSVPLYH